MILGFIGESPCEIEKLLVDCCWLTVSHGLPLALPLEGADERSEAGLACAFVRSAPAFPARIRLADITARRSSNFFLLVPSPQPPVTSHQPLATSRKHFRIHRPRRRFHCVHDMLAHDVLVLLRKRHKPPLFDRRHLAKCRI